MTSRDKERVASGKPDAPSKRPTGLDADRIATALRQVYGRIADEPLPRRLMDLVSRLKLRH
jgi:hypothetical protein